MIDSSTSYGLTGTGITLVPVLLGLEVTFDIEGFISYIRLRMIRSINSGGTPIADSIYKVIELVGTSDTSWELAAMNAVETAGKSLQDLRVAEITKLDMKVDDGKVVAYRSRVSLSFKYQTD